MTALEIAVDKLDGIRIAVQNGRMKKGADLYSEWRDFYNKHVSSWMSLEELRAECGKLQTVDNPSPEVLLVHAMHALEELQAEVALERNLKADAIHACALANIRAEWLAEALRGWWESHRPVGWTEDQHRSCPHVNLAKDAEKALATALLRDQEEG